MKKKIINSMFQMGILLLLSQSLFSCDDDEKDEPKNEDTKIENLKVEYNVNFPDVIYKYCDVAVEYVDANGNTVKVIDNISDNFSKEIIIPASAAEHNFTINANLTLKSTYPPIESSDTYEVGHNIKVTLIEYNKKNQVIDQNETNSMSEQKIKGYNLLEYLGNMTTISYNVSADYPF